VFIKKTERAEDSHISGSQAPLTGLNAWTPTGSTKFLKSKHSKTHFSSWNAVSIIISALGLVAQSVEQRIGIEGSMYGIEEYLHLKRLSIGRVRD
jgi:hypothetical protein